MWLGLRQYSAFLPANSRSIPLIAFISDLHSNWEALETALADIESLGVETVVCLGDVVGYGASPKIVADTTRERCAAVLLGNHDAALLDDANTRGFNPRARKAVEWTRKALDPEKEENWALWDWLGGLVPEMELEPEGMETVQLVHASPCDPLGEYLMPGFPGDHPKVQANFEAMSRRLVFFGHTHHPGVFEEGRDFWRAQGNDARYLIQPDKKCFINVGSVGQPRDHDPRLAYALFDGEEVRWRRLEYDVTGASNRILREPELPEALGTRLLVGR